MDGRRDDRAGDRRRILIVADAGHVGAPELVEAVRRRAAAGEPEFQLALADPAGHAEITDHQRRESRARGEQLLARALPRLSEAAGGELEASVSMRHDPMDVAEEALRASLIDEIILALSPHRLTERLHLDLAHRLEHHGLQVTTVTIDAAGEASRSTRSG